MFGKLFANKALKELTDFTFTAMVFFYILMFVMAIYLDNEMKVIRFIKTSFYVLSFGMIVILMSNWDVSLGIRELITNVFKGYTRIRSSFGFYHPNTAANIALCIILISFCIMPYERKRRYCYFIDIIMVFVILATASRTTMCALLFFVIILAFNYIRKRIHTQYGEIILTIFFLTIILMLVIFSNGSSIEELFRVSNRSFNFIKNIPILIKSGRLMIGLGFIGSGEFYQLAQYNTFYVDNYFLYVLMSTGIIGLIFISTFIIYLFVSLWQKNINKNRLLQLIGAIFLVNIFSSLGETCFMYPSFTSCFVYTVIYLAVVNIQKQKKLT